MIVAKSLDAALIALREHDDARVIQGGTDLMVEINFNHLKPTTMVSLRHIPELRTITRPDGYTISIGSGVPYSQLEIEPVASVLPALAQASRTVGSPQIRAAGSLGGNLGTCSPAGDTLPVMFALDADIHLQSSDSHRTVSIHQFMTGVKRNVKRHDEIITAVDFPIIDGWQGYSKVGVRNAMVISVASACLVADHKSGYVRLALGSVGPTIIRCRETEQWLKDNTSLTRNSLISPDIAREFGARASRECSPIDDHRSTAQYRRHAISILAARLLQKAYS
ncbi:MAG: FAD binding domain-containing protein [Ilumatobacteraceae bacterium]